MSLADEMVDALKARENDVSATVTISGTSYACSASAFSHTKKIEVGGFELEADLSLSIRRSLFVTLPAEQTTLTFSSRTFRIEKVIEPPGSAFIRLICVSNTRGS